MSTYLSHRQEGYNLLMGHGLEIGALHQPATIPAHCKIEYCDAQSKEDSLRQFPELKNHDLVEVNYICDLDKKGLSLFGAERFDFIVINHVLEHVANPIKVVEEIFRVTKIGGHVVLSIPDKDFTFDKERDLTSFEHLQTEYENHVTEVTDEHYLDFLKGVHPDVVKNCGDQLQVHINHVRQKREHAHVWDSQSFSDFMLKTFERLRLKATRVFVSVGKDNQSEYFSVWKKFGEMNIFEQEAKMFPTPQNALDLFKGEWASKLPPPYSELMAGQALLFQDPRMVWAIDQFGGVQDCKVLELGPLEAGHSYMLERSGARAILSIEPNPKNYMKCLITKEVVNLKNTRFLLGDFIPYLKHTPQRYDICILASGVLFNLKNPVELIYLISKVSTKIMIWTHYYDEDLIHQNPNVKPDKFTGTVEKDYQGFKHTLYRRVPEKNLEWHGFDGTEESFTMWMSKQDILSCLNYFGFNELKVEFDEPGHPNGPCLSIVGYK
jgi:SAM-dependent methyltransferase